MNVSLASSPHRGEVMHEVYLRTKTLMFQKGDARMMVQLGAETHAVLQKYFERGEIGSFEAPRYEMQGTSAVWVNCPEELKEGYR